MVPVWDAEKILLISLLCNRRPLIALAGEVAPVRDSVKGASSNFRHHIFAVCTDPIYNFIDALKAMRYKDG